MSQPKLAHVQNFVFDADGTLLESENPYMNIAKVLQCDHLVKQWVHDYLDGKLTYQHLVDQESDIFVKQYNKIFGKTPRIGDLEKYLPKVEIKPQAWDIAHYLLANHKNIYVLSSGFLYLVKDLLQLKIKLENIHANRFLYDTSGEFIMIKIDVSGDKIDGYETIMHEDHLKKAETVYIGDNAFDEKVIAHVLKNNGWVIFFTDSEKEFKLKKQPNSDRFIKIDSLYKIKELV